MSRKVAARLAAARHTPRHGGGPDLETKAGIVAIAAAAAVTSFAALADLAKVSGWRDDLAWCLPITIDLYAAVTTRIWLARSTPPTARAHARAHALAAISTSMVGNAVSHALSYGALRPGAHAWLLVVAVSLVPPAALAGVTHLAALLRQPDHDRPIAPSTVPGAAPGTVPTADRRGESVPAAVRPHGMAAPTAPAAEPTAPATGPTAPATGPTAPGRQGAEEAVGATGPNTAPTAPPPTKVQLTKGAPRTEPEGSRPIPGTAPPDRADQRPARTTVPGLAQHAIAAAGARPVTVELTVPPARPTEPTAPATESPADAPRHSEPTAPSPQTAPTALRPGARPDAVTVEKTRALYRQHRQNGHHLNDRQLAAAAQAAGLAIGRRACGRIIQQEEN
ncbi:DUF2637 domain-containing protein [Actinomadura nitritigenes]|uniref:DUF2637 domain-containing protein n=1 Tax=Actinomadura nitritigenes TaxID=134602 RepID=UPI003D8EB5AC